MDAKPTYLDIILEMTEAGATDGKIADALNARGYHTPGKGTSWTTKTIRYYRNKHSQDSISRQEERPVPEDFYPYVVELGTDFYCEPPGPRRYGRQKADE